MVFRDDKAAARARLAAFVERIRYAAVSVERRQLRVYARNLKRLGKALTENTPQCPGRPSNTVCRAETVGASVRGNAWPGPPSLSAGERRRLARTLKRRLNSERRLRRLGKALVRQWVMPKALNRALTGSI